MSGPSTLSVLAGGLGQAFTDQQLKNAYYDTLILDWSSTLAASAASEANQRNGTGGFFVVTMSCFTAWVPAPDAGAINYTALATGPSPTKADNTWPTLDFLTAQLRFDNRQIGQNVAVRVPLLFGTTAQPRYYPYTQPVIRPGETVFCNLTNASPQGIRAQLLFEGYVVR